MEFRRMVEWGEYTFPVDSTYYSEDENLMGRPYGRGIRKEKYPWIHITPVHIAIAATIVPM